MHFTMPVPPLPDHEYYDFYQTFVRSMNTVKQDRQSDRIYDAINLTAQDMHTSPSFIARLLVAFGLQAPKDAFPEEFVAYVTEREATINYFNFERSDYLDDLSLLWEYEDVNRYRGSRQSARRERLVKSR